jgi:hypothetical protein
MAARGAVSTCGAGHTLKAMSAVFTFGELHILPTGLGLFARLAPLGYGAIAAALLFALDPAIRRIEAARSAEIIALNVQPELA